MVVSFGPRFRTRARALLAVSALAALAVPTRSFAQAPTFNTVIMTPTGGQPWEFPKPAAVGDFDGDGKLDALVADGTGTLRVLLGNGDGTFSQHNVGVDPVTTSNAVDLSPGFTSYLPHGIDGLIAAKAVDVNGDGKLDLVCAMGVHINFAPLNGITVLINMGNDANGVPQFTATHYFLPFSDIRSLTVGDLNGDGNGDFVVGGAYGQLQIYLSNGPGTFARGQYTNLMPNVGGAVGAGVIADVNGDGKADFIVTSNQALATDIFFGNGDGTLQAPAVIANDAIAVAVADVNNDHKPDLVEGFGDGSVSVSLNNGNGTFGSPASFPTVAGGGVSGFFMSDVNGDGNLDVALSLYSAGQVAILLGNGDGTFGASYLYGGIPHAVDVTLADFTGDGKPEIASASANGYGGQNYAVLTNTTVNADSTPPVITAPANIIAEATGPSGAVGNFTATAHDDVDGSVDVTADPVSGSTFPLDTTTVLLSATDRAHNTATASFTVTVRDTTPPSLYLPVSITFETTGPSGAVVSYSASATDIVDGSASVTCAPLSGATFALGTTQVSCSATDAHGNTASGNFPVTVSDTKAPVATASLVAVRGGGDDESMQSFRVVFSATDLVGVNTLSASLNGITVTNGQIVQLKIIKSGAQKTKRDDGRLQIQATSFTLTVTAADAAGNTGSATAVPAFVKNGKDDDDRKDNDDRKGTDDHKGKG